MREVLREEQVQQYNKAVEACAERLEAFASACPYNQDRIARGLPVRIPLGPDDVEQWALKATGSAGGVQLRFQAFSASQVRLVPGGLDPLQHWQLGQAVTSPLDQEVAIPDDCNFACRRWVTHDFSAWLERQQRVVDRCLHDLQPIDLALRSMQHADA